MGLQDEETDDHRSEGFGQQWVVSREELLEGDEVIITLTHLLARDGDHIVVHPVVDGLMTKGSTALRYLCLVVREDEVKSAAVDVESFAQVFGAHRRAFHVPSGEAFTPRRRPVHDMLRCGFLP